MPNYVVKNSGVEIAEVHSGSVSNPKSAVGKFPMANFLREMGERGVPKRKEG